MSQKVMDEEVRDAEETKREFGVNFAALDAKAVAEKEPHLKAELAEPIELIKATGALEPTEVTEPNEVREVTKRDEVTWIATLATGRAETKKALSIEDVIAVGGAQRTGIGCAADTDTTGVLA